MATREEYDSALDFIDGLKKRGVYRFSGFGLTFEAGNAPPAAPGDHKPNLVDAGGGILVDKDLFGHEGA